MVNFANLGSLFGLDAATFFILLTLYYVVVYIYRNKLDTQIMWLIIVTPLIALGLSGAFSSTELDLTPQDSVPGEPKAWQEEYEFNARAELVNYELDVANTNYYNYEDPIITAVANKIVSESDSPREALKRAILFTKDNIQYVKEDDEACTQGSAPEILKKGTGQCDTMSIVNIAILRKMGIAARPVGGCAAPNPTCKLQALVQSVGVVEAPKIEQIDLDQDIFSRGANSGLHAWTTAWLPDEGWVTIESTLGTIASTKCYYYHVEVFPENSEKEKICNTDNRKYAEACYYLNLREMSEQGLGLVTEVDPQ